MLLRIVPAQLRLGMYVESIEGSWLDHPFWKSRFLLSEYRHLVALQASNVPALWINLEKGIAPVFELPASTEPAFAEHGASTAEQDAVPAEPKGEQGQQPIPASMSEELEQAGRIVEESREVVLALFEQVRLGEAAAADQLLPTVERISASVERNRTALITLTRLKSADEYTYLHSVAVCAMMVGLARQLGLDENTVQEAGLAGLLHDVGKLSVPQMILNKPASLSADEFSVIRGHPERGYQMLKEIGCGSDAVLDVVLHHHEKIDGTGYPHGLKGDEISLLARMGAVCDVYDAVTSDRPYKRAWPASEALARMYRWKGHFDEQVLSSFIRCVGIYPVGALVKLNSNELAVVSEQNCENLTRPVIRIFYSVKLQRDIPVHEVDLASPTEQWRTIAREDPASWGFHDWSERSIEILKPRSVRLVA